MGYDVTANEGFVNLGFDAAAGVSLAKNDIVEITADNTVNKPSGAGSIQIVGVVMIATKTAGGKCTVETRGTKVRTLTSGAAVAVGAVVVNATNKIINYVAETHDPAAIVGWAITSTNAADVNVTVLLK